MTSIIYVMEYLPVFSFKFSMHDIFTFVELLHDKFTLFIDNILFSKL
jgi:hypothetical protein